MWIKELLFGKARKEGEAYSALLSRYDAYLQLLRARNGILEAFADLESMAQAPEICGWGRLRVIVLRLNTQAFIMAKMLQGLSGGSHDEVFPVLESAATAIRGVLPPAQAEPPSEPLVKGPASSGAGGVPGGFSLSPSAFIQFLRHNDAEEMAQIFWETLDPADPEHLKEVSDTLRRTVLAGALPPALEFGIRQALEETSAQSGASSRFRVFEDGNRDVEPLRDVAAEDVPKACRETFARYFDADAVLRRLAKGYGALEMGLKVRVEPMAAKASKESAASAPAGMAPGEPVKAALQNILAIVAPAPQAEAVEPAGKPGEAASLYAAVQYMHEAALAAVAKLSGLVEEGAGKAGVRIEEWLPIDLRVVPLGSGLSPRVKGGTAHAEEVTSAPGSALLRGLMDESVQRGGQRISDMEGFLSVMSGSLIMSPDVTSPCWALISDRYLQFNSRVGYHFAELEAYAGPRQEDNRLSFVFKGGMGEERESRLEAQFIAGALRGLGFRVRQKADFVAGVLGPAPAEQIEGVVADLGRLLICASHPDLVIRDEGQAASFAEAFLKADYKKILEG